MKLSIIIPIYNIEKYLSECLDSIVCQDCTNIEVILVNDGSTDNSGKIADSYAQKYFFIQVIHQKNQGVSVARNNGLLNSKGEYIWFVDGDDWIDHTALLKCDKMTALDADVVFFGSKEVYGQTAKKMTNFGHSILSVSLIENLLNDLLFANVIKWFVWDKIIKRKIIIDNKIFFSKNYELGEDYLYNILLLTFSKKFLYLDDELYYYRKLRINSASTFLTESKIEKQVDLLKDSIDIIESSNLKISSKESLLIFSSLLWFGIQPQLSMLNSKDKQNGYRSLYNIYEIYKEKGLSEKIMRYNRGAKLLNILIKFTNWRIGYHIYAVLINLRRSKFGFWLLDKLGG